MNLGIEGKVALVCGASKGLGRACAENLAAAGCPIVMCARDRDVLATSAVALRTTYGVAVAEVPADLAKEGEAERVVEAGRSALGRIDILVVNSGGPKPGTFFEIERPEWDRAYAAMLGYVVDLYRVAIPPMVGSGWGRIINITSVAVKQPSPGLVLSTVFRTGVVALAKCLATELIRNNVTINNVCPGAFRTDRAVELMTANAQRKGVSVETIEAESTRSLPSGRYQPPMELGALVAYLASEHASSLTGATIQLDQGICQGLL